MGAERWTPILVPARCLWFALTMDKQPLLEVIKMTHFLQAITRACV
jgi:hypothetical protein